MNFAELTRVVGLSEFCTSREHLVCCVQIEHNRNCGQKCRAWLLYSQTCFIVPLVSTSKITFKHKIVKPFRQWQQSVKSNVRFFCTGPCVTALVVHPWSHLFLCQGKLQDSGKPLSCAVSEGTPLTAACTTAHSVSTQNGFLETDGMHWFQTQLNKYLRGSWIYLRAPSSMRSTFLMGLWNSKAKATVRYLSSNQSLYPLQSCLFVFLLGFPAGELQKPFFWGTEYPR